LTKQELIKQIAIKTNQSVKSIAKIYKDIEDIIIECIKNDKKVVLSPIGTITLVKRAKRTIKRITDQKVITIPATIAAKIKPSKKIKDIVKNIDLKETI
jgi:nucleoid DNA-binding protein